MKTYTIILLLTALPALASAESYLCVEDHATGFQFNATQKTWEQIHLSSLRKYLVKSNTDKSLKGKWIVSEIGESVPFASAEDDFTSNGALRGESVFGQFAMNRKSLRFVKTYILGYWTDSIPSEQDGTFVEGRNAPHIAIGKCSVLER